MMSAASQYWRWVKINAAGNRLVEELSEAKAFMQQQFPALLNPLDCTTEPGVKDSSSHPADLTDAEIQRSLIRVMQTDADEPNQKLAECCLRCFISNRIDWVCRDLAANFGQKGQFGQLDLLPLVLDDADVATFRTRRHAPLGYPSIASKALQTFDSERGQLSTWVKRLVISSPAMTAFLAERGIYLQSKWSVLNSKTPQFLQRRLDLPFDQLPFFSALLNSYRAVYQRDWLKSKSSKSSKCPPPTLTQLTEMAAILQAQFGRGYSPEEILASLEQLADRIREASHPRPISLEPEQYQALIEAKSAPEPDDDEQQNEFLTDYRQHFKAILTEAIEQTVLNRFRYYQKRDAVEAQKFLKGLSLFHCHAIAMTKLKTHLQKEQYQVTRLLQLLKLREDVKRNMQIKLRAQVRALAAQYITLAQLEQLMEKIESALEEQVDSVMEEARIEASTAKRDPGNPRSLFAASLCRYLDECSYFDTRSLES